MRSASFSRIRRKLKPSTIWKMQKMERLMSDATVPVTVTVRYIISASATTTIATYAHGNRKKLNGTTSENVMKTMVSAVPQMIESKKVMPSAHPKKNTAYSGFATLSTL